MKKMKKSKKSKKNNPKLAMVCFCICAGILAKHSDILGMQMGGFDIEVGSGENYEWYWEEEQQWSWEQQESPIDGNAESEPSREEIQPSDDLEWNGQQPSEYLPEETQTEPQIWITVPESDVVSAPISEPVFDSDVDSISESIPESTSESMSEFSLTPTPSPAPTCTWIPSPSPTLTPTPLPTKNPKFAEKDANAVKSEENNTIDLKVDFRTEIRDVPVIHVTAKCSLQVLSLRLNGVECPWHWEEDSIYLEKSFEKCDETCENKVELLMIVQGNKLVKMTPWIFSS